jgi:hypothetical protein
MRSGGGKSKGSAFERQIAKALSLWITGGKDSTQLIRSVLSGGWTRGQKSEGGFRHVGDLAPNGPAGEIFRRMFAVECKHNKKIDLYGLWTRSDDGSTLVGWWNKIVADSAEADVAPMLIFRSNCMPIMVGMLTGQPVSALSPREVATFGWLRLSIFPFDQLLKCPPDLYFYGKAQLPH